MLAVNNVDQMMRHDEQIVEGEYIEPVIWDLGDCQGNIYVGEINWNFGIDCIHVGPINGGLIRRCDVCFVEYRVGPCGG